MQTSTASELSSASAGGVGPGPARSAPPPIQDSYVQGLVQQIKLLELEINYLKQHAGNSGTNKDNLSPKKDQSVRSETVSPSSRSEKKVVIAATKEASEDHHKSRGAIRDRDDDQIRNLRQELMHKNARLESVLAEKTQLSHRIKALEADYFFSVYLLKHTILYRESLILELCFIDLLMQLQNFETNKRNAYISPNFQLCCFNSHLKTVRSLLIQ